MKLSHSKHILILLIIILSTVGFSFPSIDSTTTNINLSIVKPATTNGENQSADGLHFTIQEKTDMPLKCRSPQPYHRQIKLRW